MRIAVIVGKFAPFHRARLESAGQCAHQRRDELIGVEIASLQPEYGWKDDPEAPQFFAKHVLFEGRDYWQVKPHEVRTALKAKLDELAPDLVVLSGYAPVESRVALKWAIQHRVPRVLISDTHRLTRRDDPIWRVWPKRLLISCFNSALVGGRPQLRYLTAMGFAEERVFAGSTVIEGGLFARELDGARAPGAHMRVLTCARLVKEKNLPFVLRAMASGSNGWTWTLAGAGPEEAELRTLIEQFHLGDRVTLLGHVDYDELPKLYAAHDAYLQPSISEQWGLVVNEAMFSGLPVLVSNRCGCSEDLVLEGENGFLFDPTREADFNAAIERMKEARPRWLDMGRESQRIVADWNVDRFARSLLQACDAAQAANERRSAPLSVLAKFLA